MKIHINPRDSEPIYSQIKNQIKENILTSRLKDGEKLPSIRFLAKELKVSMLTTKRAFDELEAEGFIQSVQGRGNFVSVKNKNFIIEEYYKKIEENLSNVFNIAKIANIDKNTILKMFEDMLKEKYER